MARPHYLKDRAHSNWKIAEAIYNLNPKAGTIYTERFQLRAMTEGRAEGQQVVEKHRKSVRKDKTPARSQEL